MPVEQATPWYNSSSSSSVSSCASTRSSARLAVGARRRGPAGRSGRATSGTSGDKHLHSATATRQKPCRDTEIHPCFAPQTRTTADSFSAHPESARIGLCYSTQAREKPELSGRRLYSISSLLFVSGANVVKIIANEDLRGMCYHTGLEPPDLSQDKCQFSTFEPCITGTTRANPLGDQATRLDSHPSGGMIGETFGYRPFASRTWCAGPTSVERMMNGWPFPSAEQALRHHLYS